MIHVSLRIPEELEHQYESLLEELQVVNAGDVTCIIRRDRPVAVATPATVVRRPAISRGTHVVLQLTPAGRVTALASGTRGETFRRCLLQHGNLSANQLGALLGLTDRVKVVQSTIHSLQRRGMVVSVEIR